MSEILKMNIVTRHRTSIILLSILICAICLRIVFFTGITGGDTLAYSTTAYQIANGTFEKSTYVHNLRLGLILPTALFYWIWEPNEISSALYPFLCSLGNILLIFFLSKLVFADVTTGLISAGLLAMFPLEVFYASQLMPEIPLNFSMALAVYIFLKGEQSSDKKHAKWYYFLSGIVAGIAYMTKIFAVFLVLFILFYSLYKRKLSLMYLWGIIGSCCVLLPEMVFYYMQTGNPFHRLISIVLSPGSGIEPNPGNMYRSDLFLYPYYWFISLMHFGFFYYFIIAAFLYSLWKRIKETYVPMLWAGSLFLYLQFGREGKHFIHKEARFLAIITIPCLLVLGYVLAQKISKKRRILILYLTFGFLGFSSLGLISFKHLLHQTEFANLRTTAHYLRQLPEDIKAYADQQSISYIHYFLGYSKRDQIQPFNAYNYRTGENSYPVDLHQLQQGVVIVNWHTINTLKYKGITKIKYPDIIYNPPAYWKMVHTIDPPDNWVYAILRILPESSLFHNLPAKVSQKILKTTERVLKSHKEKTIIYTIEH